MGYRKTYKTNGARLGTALDAGPMASGGVRLPHGTLRAVICPECKAEVGMHCRSNTGKRLNQVHISRRRIAMRSTTRSGPMPMRPDDEVLYSDGLFAQPALRLVKRGETVTLHRIWGDEPC